MYRWVRIMINIGLNVFDIMLELDYPIYNIHVFLMGLSNMIKSLQNVYGTIGHRFRCLLMFLIWDETC